MRIELETIRTTVRIGANGRASLRVQADAAQTAVLGQSEHAVHVLDRRRGGALAEVVEGPEGDDPAAALVDVDADLDVVRARHRGDARIRQVLPARLRILVERQSAHERLVAVELL